MIYLVLDPETSSPLESVGQGDETIKKLLQFKIAAAFYKVLLKTI